MPTFALGLTVISAQPFMCIVMRGLLDAEIDPSFRAAIKASLTRWEGMTEEAKREARQIEGAVGEAILRDLSAWVEHHTSTPASE